MSNLKQFVSAESGAVTVDWVAITAGILILGIAVIYAVMGDGLAPVLVVVSETADQVGGTSLGSAPTINQ